mgnify:CR=1 FL=1
MPTPSRSGMPRLFDRHRGVSTSGSVSIDLTAEGGSQRTDKGEGESTAKEGDHVDGELGAVGLVCAGGRAGERGS